MADLMTLNPNGRKRVATNTANPGMTTNAAGGPGLTTAPGGGYRLKPEGEQPGKGHIAGAPKPPAAGQPGGNPGASTPFTPANPATVAAQDDPRLTALNERYNKYLDSYEGGMGSAMDLAAGRFRDAREGGRAAMSADAAFRGVGADTGKYDAGTQRGMQAAIANVAAEREAALGENLRGGLGIAAAPGEANRADRGLNMNWWQMQNNAGQQAWERGRAESNDAFERFMALLGDARRGPLPPGVSVPGMPGAPAASPQPPGWQNKGFHF
jgi:hypothetical protein